MNVVTDALLSYCKAGPGWVRMVTQSELDRWWKRHGQPGPTPDIQDPEVFQPVRTALWQRAQAASRAAMKAAMVAEDRPAFSRPAAPPAPARPTKEGDEAKVAVMKGAEALALVKKHRLDWPGPHPTNPGITAMRAKNALYAHVRRGGSL